MHVVRLVKRSTLNTPPQAPKPGAIKVTCQCTPTDDGKLSCECQTEQIVPQPVPAVTASTLPILYVQVVHHNQYLAIEEIEAFDSNGKNVAAQTSGGLALATSEVYGGNASFVNDGIKNDDAKWPNSVHTNNSAMESVEIKFAKPAILKNVVVWNRPDMAADRLQGAVLYGKDENGKVVFSRTLTADRKQDLSVVTTRPHDAPAEDVDIFLDPRNLIPPKYRQPLDDTAIDSERTAFYGTVGVLKLPDNVVMDFSDIASVVKLFEPSFYSKITNMNPFQQDVSATRALIDGEWAKQWGLPEGFAIDPVWAQGKALSTPSLNQGGCGSCWAFSTATAISDRAMLRAFFTAAKAGKTGDDLPSYYEDPGKNQVDCTKMIQNRFWTASPTDIVRNQHSDTDYHCEGGHESFYSLHRETNDLGTHLQEGVLDMSSCEYNRGKDGATGCPVNGWLGNGNGLPVMSQEDMYAKLNDPDFCSTSKFKFVCDDFAHFLPPEAIPQALMGLPPYQNIGPGTLTTDQWGAGEAGFGAYGKHESWCEVDMDKFRADHDGAECRCKYVFCAPANFTHDPEKPKAGHAITIVGYIGKVYVGTINQYVNAYIMRNSWGKWGDNGFYMWADSASWSPNAQFGVDTPSGQITRVSAIRVTRVPNESTTKGVAIRKKFMSTFGNMPLSLYVLGFVALAATMAF